MGVLHDDYYEAVKDYLHPGIHNFINHYRRGHLIDLSPYHGSNRVNKNGTSKEIQYQMGEQCVVPTEKRYWRKPKAKYKRKIGFLYWTRHMTQTRSYKYVHMNETPMHLEFKYMQEIKNYGSMSLNKKYFIYYCCVSVSEGLNTELSSSQLMLEKYDKKVYQKCRYCHFVVEIEKAFKEEEDTCNMSLKLLKNQDRINPQIYIIWTENQKYRVFTNCHRSFADRIFRYENIKYKFGEIPQEVIDNH